VPQPPTPGGRAPSWGFLSNHARVLACLAADPATRMRDVAIRIRVTERAVQRIIAELAGAGYLTITREGRVNRYAVHRRRPLHHPLESHRTVGELVDLAARPPE
jgi:DNA-binding MarR family transcriptional regulator